MPRGRHRHSPPLHRLLPPSAIAGVSVVCALGPWVFSEATVLRALAAAAAVTAVVGAVVMRRWDAQAGRQVADLTRARAGDEWRFEERVAELETDLEESRELRTKLEQRLRAKRAELAGLRNEHASLLRRYATAETERASALEGRRLLEIEAAEPSASPALPPARSAGRGALEAAPKTVKDGGSAENTKDAENTEGVENAGDTEAGGASSAEAEGSRASGDAPKANAVFSPEGSWLYQRALLALAGFDGDAPADDSEAEAAVAEEAADDGEPEPERAAADTSGSDPSGPEAPKGGTAEAGPVAKGATDGATEGAIEGVTEGAAAGEGAADGVTDHSAAHRSEDDAPAAHEDGERAQHEVADGHARAVAVPSAQAALPAQSAGQSQSGHFTVPTAVAVVPAPPARRQVVQGGFDFFGTQKGEPKAALDSVQNEDLADVVGQEALAVHKAEEEAEFKPAGPHSLGVGQVIDLTAHDETEQIDVQTLRSAAS
ncbi:hypothetical protein [Streptomyces sp. IBSBF 2390]|uniref:hypothetical protein n=1 Tax=Streptomyces sp. IBSBF 2390 TaxID=2903533 RepID=UPI002FDC5C67